MSTIQSSADELGLSAAVICGTARCRTVRSIEYSTHGKPMTARPIQSRRSAFRGTVSLDMDEENLRAVPRYPPAGRTRAGLSAGRCDCHGKTEDQAIRMAGKRR